MDFHTNTCCFVTSIKTRDSDNITCLKASIILVLDRHVGISAGIIVATEVNIWYRSSIYILCSFCNSDILFLATDGLPVVDDLAFGWGNWSLLFLYLNGKCSRSLFILVCICRLDGGNDVCFTFTNKAYLTILSSESSALDGVFCVMSFESCLCSANSILVVALVCFYCICIVIQTNIELYGIEVIKAATSSRDRIGVCISILLNAQEPRL